MAITKTSRERRVRFTKIDKAKKQVWGRVYEPLVIDAHGDLMMADEIEKAAYSFLASANLSVAVDENHNHIPTFSKVIESYVTKEDSNGVAAGTWIVGMQITKDGTWRKIERGEITGFSFEGSGYRRKAIIEATFQKYKLGRTSKAADGHSHLVFVELDDKGRVIKGWTSTANNHKHDVLYNTVTELTTTHRHRIILTT